MARRFPLWLTLVPLVVGIAGYWTIWTGFRDHLAADIAKIVTESPYIGGFPYRVEATLGPTQMQCDGPGLRAHLSGEKVVVNRGPWQDQLTVIGAKGVRASASVPPLVGAALGLTAPVMQASLHLIDKRIARLSAVFDTPVLHFGLLPMPVTATRFEFHFRETPTTVVASTVPTAAPQDQLVLAGSAVRFGTGDPLTLAADFALTAPAPVHRYADWRPTGTVELRSFSLSDATGEIVNGTLTAVPAADGKLRIAGTLRTICPATLRAAFAGEPPPSEMRTRLPVRMALIVLPGTPLQLIPEGGWIPRATRGQMPPCPALAR